MFSELRSFVSDKSFKIVVLENSIYINNYVDILLFDDDKMIIKSKNKLLKITGNNLLITRLENNEMQIKGNIKTIELGD